jgi:hypothetical protein
LQVHTNECVRKSLAEPQINEFAGMIMVKHHVARLDVSMDDFWRERVQKVYRLRHFECPLAHHTAGMMTGQRVQM